MDVVEEDVKLAEVREEDAGQVWKVSKKPKEKLKMQKVQLTI